MAKELLARSQVTITALSDAYTILLSPSEYLFAANNDGKIPSATTLTVQIQITQGENAVVDFTIGAITKPEGFGSISINHSAKRVTFFIPANTATLADDGKVDIPITIANVTYHSAFVWSKAKAGPAGIDANLLDWVCDWNTGKTQIDAHTVITPKLFAGVKNADGTLTGTAVGRYEVTTKSASGVFSTQRIDGISGFRNGLQTFFLDNGGNVQLGSGEQFIKYNAASGKMEFGSGVSMQWAGATYIDKDGIFTGTLSASAVSALYLDASQIVSGTISAQHIDVAALKTALITAGNIEALTLNVSKGTIGCWTIDGDSVFKGTKNNSSGFTSASGSITLGSNGLRGHKWRLDASGAGALAGGAISWDAAGKVAFDKTVSLAWQQEIDEAKELAQAMAFGKMLFRDPTFREGVNSISAYNNMGGHNVTISRIADAQAPNDSGMVLEITTTGDANPGNGGFCFANQSAPNKIFISRIIARIPIGHHLVWAANSYGIDSVSKFLTPNAGTGTWQEYIVKVSCGKDGTFQTINYFYLDKISNNALPLVWQVAYATVFDITACEKFTTTIDAEGVYTGTVNAGQITTGVLAAERIAAGSIKAEKLDAASIQSKIINASYINGLSCTFTKGTIGGWTIGESALLGSHIALDNGNRRIVVYGADAGVRSGQRVQLYYNSDGDFGFYATDRTGACVASLGSSNSIAGWTIGPSSLSKNNVSLGADGSIANQTKWQLNNDGSGVLAAGNIVWDAAGNVTFATSVSVQWSQPVAAITSALGGDGFPKLTKITATGIYTGTLSAAQVNAVAIDAASVTSGTLSADRFAAGSIRADKLDADSIRSTIVNADYISGLCCSFIRGTIGGWEIGADRISLGENDTGQLVLGKVILVGNGCEESFSGLQMVAWDGRAYFSLAADCRPHGSNKACNSIAGWSFDTLHIWKNNVSLGSDGSISNSTKWQLSNDGSGQIACGNISWDASGNVSFSSSVSVAWSAAIDSLTAALGGSTYPKLTQITATGIYTGKISAAQINVDTALVVGGSSSNGSISVRDARNTVKVTLDRQGITAVGGRIGGWIINQQTICAAAPASGHRIYLTSSGYMYNDNPNTGKDYWGLKPDGSATFGYGSISFAANGSGYLAGGNLSWDANGNLTGKDATLEDIFMTGTFRSPFVAYDGSINVGGGNSEAEMHDNLTMPGGGGWILASDFPWDASQNGRTVTIVNYKYNGTITTGKMELSAPSGKYFFEDGILKSSILLSREYVLLKGYGEGSTFYGWIVMHRGDIGTTSRYGSCAKVMYQGWVENGVIKRYKSFDGGKLTCNRTITGTYQVFFPTGVAIPTKDYTVMVTGSNIVSDTSNQVYASLTAKNTTSFIIKTADDTSRNDASFTFQVLSMADWS